MHKGIELPPPLKTRAANRGRVVGAPDMPRPRRSSEEVLEEKELKRLALAQAKAKQEAAIARVAELERELSEGKIGSVVPFCDNIEEADGVEEIDPEPQSNPQRLGPDLVSESEDSSDEFLPGEEEPESESDSAEVDDIVELTAKKRGRGGRKTKAGRHQGFPPKQMSTKVALCRENTANSHH
ncbi:hypothetical protein NUW54_g13237 [Trametes sanguinea]|uniref:Uncharacterized protein n=1 Tax=Trametes sanguinea TaxID=158606 RepID=A0ACC1MNJ2_9APHY|nr:hypothetical protein NUW54_g13237 [Trametes sanguinea]